MHYHDHPCPGTGTADAVPGWGIGVPIVCALCGAPAPGGVQPLTWTTSVEGSDNAAVTALYCDACSREHVRGIESKLDATWW